MHKRSVRHYKNNLRNKTCPKYQKRGHFRASVYGQLLIVFSYKTNYRLYYFFFVVNIFQRMICFFDRPFSDLGDFIILDKNFNTAPTTDLVKGLTKFTDNLLV